jgi:hypothetical protein
MVFQVMMLLLMVFVCTALGWLWVAAPRRAKTQDQAAAKTKEAAPEKKSDPGDGPGRGDPPATPEKSPPVAEPERPPTPPAPETPMLTWEKDVQPILERSCLNCHGVRKRGGLDLRTLASALAGGDSGAGLKPGKPEDSPLLESIVSNRMPPGKRKLTEGEKKVIRDWIAGGAKSGKGM